MLKDRISQRISQVVRVFLLNQCYRQYPLMLCPISCCLNPFVVNWVVFLLNINGRIVQGKGGYTGAIGKVCVSLKRKEG